MTVCPVCEHQQEIGFECEVCGKDLSAQAGLAGLAPPPVAVERVADLEVTIPDRVGDVGVERFGDLEQNAFAKVGNIALDATPDVEPSSQAPVGDVRVERLTDFADDRAADDGVRTPQVAGQVTCRYCKNVQATGSVCDRCGMKLPAPLQNLAKEIPVDEWVRCRSCGAPGPLGERCSECGRVITAPEA